MTTTETSTPRKETSSDLKVAIITTLGSFLWFGLMIEQDIKGETISASRLLAFLLTAILAAWFWKGFFADIKKPVMGTATIWTGAVIINLAALITSGIRGAETNVAMVISTIFASVIAGYFWQKALTLGKKNNSLTDTPSL